MRCSVESDDRGLRRGVRPFHVVERIGSCARGPRLLTCIFGICWLITFPASGAQKPVLPELNEALGELRVSAAVWRDNDTEYRAAGRAGTLPKEEMVQFAEFVAELKRQVFEDCQAVRVLGGERFLARYDCDLPEMPARSVAALPSRPEEHKTEAEEARSLDDELRKIEAEIDVMVRDKAEENARRASSRSAREPARSGQGWSAPGEAGQGGSGATARSGRGSAGRGAGEVAAAGQRVRPDDAAQASNGRRDPGAGPGDARQGESATVRKGGTPTGDDDDVVAAQIREAAEKETDPVLKEKLWAEYRKIKAARK